MNLEHFTLESYDFNNEMHNKKKEELINSEGSELISSDIDTFIRRNNELGQKDGITSTYIVLYEEEVIGFSFVNYHPEEEINGKLLCEEIEIGLGLFPNYRGKHLGPLLERELSEKLLELYPQFSIIVARIDENNKRSIASAESAGFEHIENDIYHFKRM